MIQGFTDLASKHQNFYIFDADNQSYSYTQYFQQQFRKRYFNIGNLDRALIPFLAGIATTHTKIILIDYNSRLLNQHFTAIKELACELPLDINLISLEVHQQAIYNQFLLPTPHLSLATQIPNLDIYTPANTHEALLTAKAIVENSIATYTNITLHPFLHTTFTDQSKNLDHQLITTGDDIGIITYGVLSNYALSLVDRLHQENKNAQLLHLPRLTNFNKKLITQTVNTCKQTFFLEINDELTPSIASTVTANNTIHTIKIDPTFFRPQQNRPAIIDYLYNQITSY